MEKVGEDLFSVEEDLAKVKEKFDFVQTKKYK
jgi:hypothetical protein